MSKEQQMQEDLVVTMELLPEFVKLSRAHAQLPAEDELTSGLRKMMDTCKATDLPMHAIFCMQILLDIHHVLREHASRPFDELQGTGTKVVGILDDYFRNSRNRSIGTWASQKDQVFEILRAKAKDWALSDMPNKLPFRAPGGVKSPPNHLLKNHPVLAGLLVFNLNLRLQEAGITLCNAWGSVLYPAHLYNAA